MQLSVWESVECIGTRRRRLVRWARRAASIQSHVPRQGGGVADDPYPGLSHLRTRHRSGHRTRSRLYTMASTSSWATANVARDHGELDGASSIEHRATPVRASTPPARHQWRGWPQFPIPGSMNPLRAAGRERHRLGVTHDHVERRPSTARGTPQIRMRIVRSRDPIRARAVAAEP